MKNRQLYERVEIDGKEENLPKENGDYICTTKHKALTIKPFSNNGGIFSPVYWLSNIDWYLLPYTSEIGRDEEYYKKVISILIKAK